MSDDYKNWRKEHGMDNNRGDWMQTYSGIQFFPMVPRMDEIETVDIAHALANICRFGGHVNKFYSVAEHCVLVSQSVPEEFALEALLHDAAEAYIGDMVRPLKRNMKDFQRCEDRILNLILRKFKVTSYQPRLENHFYLSTPVVQADNRILLDERSALLNEPPARWHPDIENAEPLGVKIMPLSPAGAELAYLQRLAELTDVI